MFAVHADMEIHLVTDHASLGIVLVALSFWKLLKNCVSKAVVADEAGESWQEWPGVIEG